MKITLIEHAAANGRRTTACAAVAVDQAACFFTTAALQAPVAGGALPLTQESFRTDGIERREGDVCLRAPGIYRVSFLVHFPAQAVADTVISLRVNGRDHPAMVRPVRKRAAGVPATAAGETLLEVGAPILLRLVSATPISLLGEEGETLLSLTIEQVG